MLDIHPIPAFNDNYIWCVSDPGSGEALLVDPGQAKPVQAYLERHSLAPTAILVTHHHPDHVGAVRQLAGQYGIARIHGPAGSPFDGLTDPLDENDRVEWQGVSFRVLRVPGHTLDHIAFYADSDRIGGAPALFCGDTLFACGCGRLFEGSPTQMRQSLEKLRNLPDRTRVYCAHEYTLANLRYSRHLLPTDENLKGFETHCIEKRESGHPTLPTTLEQEKSLNPFLRWDDPAVISAVEGPANDPDEVFARVRAGKDRF